MDHVKIGKLTEDDLCSIIAAAGGRRFSEDDSRETTKNADFVLGNAIIELKLVDEEGLEKKERRQKLANIFRPLQPDRPVIVLRPETLDQEGQRAYDAAMIGPIKSHIEKANKQLKTSAEEMGGTPVRVLILINNGYTALSHSEFKELAFRRASNSTSNIDCVVVAGFYYYGDTFDNYFFPKIDLMPLRVDRPFADYEKLRDGWQAFGVDLLTKNYIFGERTHEEGRTPVEELTYVLDDITYVKPAPPMGKPSEFFKNGRPRTDSSGITTCPPVAKSFPDFDMQEWEQFKKRFPSEAFYGVTYTDWQQNRRQKEEVLSEPLKPFVPVRVEFGPFMEWCKRQGHFAGTQSLCDYANTLFGTAIRPIIDRARSFGDSPIIVPRHILLITEVIGKDVANDLSSIYMVGNDLSDSGRSILVQHQRVCFEHGLALAAAYALKHGLDMVRFEKDMTNAWV